MLFEKDERFRNIDPNWSSDDLLQKEGVFKLSHACEVLDLNQPALRRMLNEEMKVGKDVYASYGLKREYGTWVVRMSRFRNVFERIRDTVGSRPKRLNVKRMPKDISPEDYFRLAGVYKLSEVMEPKYLPYAYEHIIAILKRGLPSEHGQPIPREISGCWQDPKISRFWLCDFRPFLVFVYSQWHDISMDEAKARVDQSLKKP